MYIRRSSGPGTWRRSAAEVIKKTELALVELLRKAKITRWRRHYKNLPGTPDFVFIKKRVAVFVDGCFWHGCPRCKLRSKSNKKFWNQKIKKNRERDARVNRDVVGKGWKVLRFWEHQIKEDPQKAINKIQLALS